MGREAQVHVQIGMERGEARVLLEAAELILRGEVRRRYARDTIADLLADADGLTFRSGDEVIRLGFDPATARKWMEAIRKPPPGLADKLGLSDGASLWVLTEVDDAVLAEAIAEAWGEKLSATLALAVVRSAGDLDAVLSAHAARPVLPLWLAYPKGSGGFGEAAVRDRLRGAGYRDSKSCAVSDALTATRYALPKV